MSDSDTPQRAVGREGAGETSAPESGSQAPPGDAATLAVRSQTVVALRGLRLEASGAIVWLVLAAACVAGGVVGSLLLARAIAHQDAADARRAFHRGAASVSALAPALQRRDDTAAAAGAFFARSPKATSAELRAWARSEGALRASPALLSLEFTGLVAPRELAAYEALLAGHAPTARPATPASGASLAPAQGVGALALPSGAATAAGARSGAAPASVATRTATSAAGTTGQIVLAGTGPLVCAQLAGLARAPARVPSPSVRRCAPSAALSAARATGLTHAVSISRGGKPELVLVTPVYRGGGVPATQDGRRAAFIGWQREVLRPQTLLRNALNGREAQALRLRYQSGSASAAFSSGVPAREAQSAALKLDGHWSVRVYGPALKTSVLANGDALAALLAGSVLALLLGAAVVLLGLARRPGRVPASGLRAHGDRAQAHQELYDSLTGLPNRALTLDRTERSIARAQRPGWLVGAVVIDLDWFAHINDKLGREAGDELLAIVADRLDGAARTGDSVGRLQDDEFMILVECQPRGARLDLLAARVIEVLHEPAELPGFGPSVHLTASVGVALGRYSDPEALLRDARLALDSSKNGGRDRYTVFNANTRGVTEGGSTLEAELNLALADGQFELLYQPIYDLTSGRAVALEAFLRWVHPERGMLPPAEFLALAEDNGLIVPIGRWALEEACSRAAAWNVSGHRVGVSVAVAARQLDRDGIATDVLRALQQSGLEPSLLTLEVAEAVVMRDLPAATARMQELKQLGVRLAIDDFGDGYAYRSDLEGMPLDFLKVDRSALASAEGEDYRGWLFDAVLAFGRDLGLTVVAKGIETREQMASLVAMECHVAQGAFLAMPTPAADVDQLLRGTLALPVDTLRPPPAPLHASPTNPVAWRENTNPLL
jgi:diguanylate cyclase (GGDEF)-like protein